MDLSGRRLGEFTLREQIGEGGCAVVYRCEQPQLRRSAVVKVLHERGQRSDAALDRFRREAQLASQLDHPYAAHVYAFGDEDDGLFWIAMELVQGTALDDWLEAHGPMPLAQFVPFFECVADVVHAAHERGIIHRDLKPSNVMVIDSNGRLFPKLLDFGIAKLIGELALAVPEHPEGTEAVTTAPLRAAERRAQRTRTDPADQEHRLTRTSAKLGSTAYMSPEQWTNPQAVGPASDIYSLGILAYEVLTGRKPFTAESTHEYYHRHVYAEAPPLGEGFPPEDDRVIRRALAKAPEARHGNALELAAELRKALRTSRREQLRTSAQQWDDDRRPRGLLWGADVLEETLRSVPQQTLSPLESMFLKDSQRWIRRARWVRRALAAIAAASVLAAVLLQIRAARQVTEATITQAELEQGRSALLHEEPEAQLHLSRAYQRGDHSPSTAFMLARALQPRLAEQARLASIAGRMWSAAFSPDGRQIVTTDDRAAQVWDAQTYRRTSVLFHGDTVYQALYSADGARIVTAGGDGTVKIWDAATGGLVRELRHDGARLRYFIAALSPDGRFVAAINTRGDLTHVWDTATGATVAEIRGEGLEFPGLAFSPDGRWLTATGGGDVCVIDARTWKEVVAIRGPRVRSLAFDPTGARLVTGDATGEVAIWEIPSGARLRRLREAGESIYAVAYSPDGRLVAAGSRDGVVQVWQGESGELQGQLNARHSKVLAVEFDRASKTVLAAGVDGAVVVAEAGEATPVAVLDGPRSLMIAHFDPDARRVIGASLEGTAQIWDATPPYRRWRSPPVADDCGLAPGSTSGSTPDGRFVAIGCRDHPTRVWDTVHDQLLAELPNTTLVADDSPSASPAVSSVGDRAAIARGNVVEVYEIPGGRLGRTIAHGAPVSALAFAPTGRDVVSGATDGSLLVTRDGGARIALLASPGGVDAVGFLPDGRVVAADAQRRLRVFDPGGTVLADLEIPTRLALLRIDGARLVGVPYTESAAPSLLIDVERYRVVARLEGYTGQLFSARWTTDGQILTAGTDGTARLWDGATGRLLQTYRGSSRFLADATLTADGLVVASGADGLLRFWERNSGCLLWALPAHISQVYGVHADGADIVTRGITGELARWRLSSPEQVIQACGDHERCAIVEP
ncbi:MAG TPA: protein kinase [Kofleriaceae bacterium]